MIKSKSFLFYLSSLLIIFLAISFTLINPNYINLKSLLTSYPNPFHHLPKTHIPNSPSPCVFWMSPILSGGGYSSEAWSYILALTQHIKVPNFRLKIEHHGDLESLPFWEGLPSHMKNLAMQLHQTQCRINQTIVLCHSEPGAWYPPLFETLPCPPTGYKGFMFVIGRTMFETDRVNSVHVKRCNRMDKVWVPTDFHVSTFVDSGVDQSKVVKIVQPIDVDFFDPSRYAALELDLVGDFVLGERHRGSNSEKEFVFLSVFKWEYRKGWDVLLKAYLNEFSSSDPVALYLLTNPYHSDSDFRNKIAEFVKDHKVGDNNLANVYVIDSHIAQSDLPKLYKGADAFVLPSRGEGWGRPIVEAMSMSLPVIATNWSGPTEYLTADNSYPLPVDKMSEVVGGPFEGHLWAEPSPDKLGVLMRHVMSNVDEAKAKGRKARNDMINRFSPKVVAGIVADHIQDILDKML
ncbi:UDP-Glycosyltransferase superfamily protein [Euphorbia peplus]|nr:UDP-Glycosyltransferase superfamily protein [Euphorbia peplus]